ncbi:MAG TPA: adenosylcobinamide-GDP ribazoletransferase [Xanthobacteraceae bacterium]|nr:adenosylcobinamide-GDP ribazoletransferase [Xanthobacteraceae bacterium]
MRSPAGIAGDLAVAIAFCTRLPVGALATDRSDLARASWAMPVAGALVALAGALAYWVPWRLGVAPSAAAAVALAATLLITGCLHEDGLADTADGFGGGDTRERKLAIMRDSRIGTFGVCALIVSFALRWGALASLATPLAVAAALIAAHVAARGVLPAFMRFVPPARPDGLAAQAGRPPLASVVVAALIGAAALGLGLGPVAMVIATMLLAVAGAFMAWLTGRQIGGQTGDVLGALEQTAEMLVLLVAAGLQHQVSAHA